MDIPFQQERKRVWKGAKQEFVLAITNDKNITAIKTASLVAVLTAFGEGMGVYVSFVIRRVTGAVFGYEVPIPPQWILAPMMLVVFFLFDWADKRTEKWRSIVEETTGEEAASDGGD